MFLFYVPIVYSCKIMQILFLHIFKNVSLTIHSIVPSRNLQRNNNNAIIAIILEDYPVLYTGLS